VKLTKSQLKQIIKEETESVLNENAQLMTTLGTSIYNDLMALKKYIKDPTQEKEGLTLYFNLLEKVEAMDRELLLAKKIPNNP